MLLPIFKAMLWMGMGSLLLSANAQTPSVAKVGMGQIWLAPKANAPVLPKEAPYRTEEMAKRALPTNTWYSSLTYMKWSDVLHAHPLTFKATEAGLEMGVPSKEIAAIEKVPKWPFCTPTKAQFGYRQPVLNLLMPAWALRGTGTLRST